MTLRSAFLALALGTAVASAETSAISDPARSALESRAAEMSRALLANDAAAIYDLLPPPLVTEVASATGRTVAEFRLLFIDNLMNNRPGTGVAEHRLDLAAARLFTGDDGVVYALVPTSSLAFDPYRGRFRIEGTTVAIPSGETWHFFTISDAAAMAQLVAVYPALAAASLQPVTLTPAP